MELLSSTIVPVLSVISIVYVLFAFSFAMNLSIQVQKYFLIIKSLLNLSALSKSICRTCFGTLLGTLELFDLFDLERWPSVVVYVSAAV